MAFTDFFRPKRTGTNTQKISKITKEFSSIPVNDLSKLPDILDSIDDVIKPLCSKPESVKNNYASLMEFVIAAYTLFENIGTFLDTEYESTGMVIAGGSYLELKDALGKRVIKVQEVLLNTSMSNKNTAKLHGQHANTILTIENSEQEAVKHVQIALRMDDREPLANYLQGMIYRRQKKFFDSYKCFQICCDQEPGDRTYQAELDKASKLLKTVAS